jgi:hypothetical protein
MDFLLEDQMIEITIPFTDRAGNAVTPTSVTATLFDGEDFPLVVYDPIAFSGGATSATVVVLGQFNRLQGEDLAEARRLESVVTHPGGVERKVFAYGVEAEKSLVVMRNSFQTYEMALVVARSRVNIETFESASEDRRKAALQEAYTRICGLPMIYSIVDADGNLEAENEIYMDTWQFIDADAFLTSFPSHFRKALRMAQVVEADELLQGNIVARKHAQGIASETIGESSVTLRSGFSGSTDVGVSAATMSILNGYINRIVKIGRA